LLSALQVELTARIVSASAFFWVSVARSLTLAINIIANM
jgi:hypothetical protein